MYTEHHEPVIKELYLCPHCGDGQATYIHDYYHKWKDVAIAVTILLLAQTIAFAIYVLFM